MMRPIRVIENGVVTTNFQSVVPMEGLHADRSVLDPLLGAISSDIDLPEEVETSLSGPVTSVTYPGGYATISGGSYVLTDLHVACNNLLRIIEDYTDEDHTKLTKSVEQYHTALALTLVGKKGLLNRQVLTSRVGKSIRAVAVACADRSPEWIGLPSRAMSSIGICEGDLVTFCRFPILTDGGVEVVRAYPRNDDAISVHPVLHEQLNLDHDGDEIPVWAVPREHYLEAEAAIVSYYKGKDSKKMPYPVAKTKGDSWDASTPVDRIHQDVVTGLAPTGASISPLDIIDGNVDWYEKASGKDLLEDTREIINGLSLEQIRERVCHVNKANLIMKRYVGPAGALGTAIKVVALRSGDQDVLVSAMYINERLTQSLMDAKHNVGSTDQQEFIQIMDALNLTGPMQCATRAQVVKKLTSAGMDEQKVKPFCDYHYAAAANPKDAGVKSVYADTVATLELCTTKPKDLEDMIHTLRSVRLGDPVHAEDPLTASVLRVLNS